ncbi:RHS Repeat family protein, partial [Yersinia pestis PY-29]
MITPTGARWRYGYDAFGRRIRKLRVVDNPP